MIKGIILLTLCASVFLSSATKFTSKQVKCHVCKAVVQEMEMEVSKVDPNKIINTNGFRMDADGNIISNSIPMIKSETFLTEVMENICDKMEDYLRVTHKKTGKFMLMKIVVDGKMNPESSNVDFVQDEDLNKSLGHYCLEILDDHEEVFLKNFQSPTIDDNLDIQICSLDTSYCEDAAPQDDYEFDRDEL